MHGVVGYTPGLFDLFHVGHLEVLRRARAACDHLVVGVLTDEFAEEVLGFRPYIPLIERMKIVENVRYVAGVTALAELDLGAARAAHGFDRVFTGPHPELDWQTAGAPVTGLTGLPETGSPILRAALTGEPPNSSVA